VIVDLVAEFMVIDEFEVSLPLNVDPSINSKTFTMYVSLWDIGLQQPNSANTDTNYST